MAESNNKANKDSLVRGLLNGVLRQLQESTSEVRLDSLSSKELISTLATIAGKGKDEIVQILCREIGQAVAAMFKEPFEQVLENRKLQITLELVPKSKTSAPGKSRAKAAPSKAAKGKNTKKASKKST